MSEDVELSAISMDFGDFRAVNNVDVTIKAGEFFSFLGPSGCGKTTLLRLISGFMEPTEGAIRIGGQDMGGVGPNKRPTVLIFQNLALFPLMTVAENIVFGLEVRGVDKAKRRKRALDLLELIAMPDAADKKVSELSGGQRQRVAIARALAVEPKVMLLDEPLSALDLKLRQHMRAELRAIQKRTGGTFIETGVSHASFEGSFAHIFLHGVDGREIVVNAVNDGAMPDLPSGERVRVSFAAADAVVLPRGDLAQD